MIDHHSTKFLGLTCPQSNIAPEHAVSDEMRHRVNVLNREMLRLSLPERRRRWTEYCRRLDEIVNVAAKPRDPLPNRAHVQANRGF